MIPTLVISLLSAIPAWLITRGKGSTLRRVAGYAAGALLGFCLSIIVTFVVEVTTKQRSDLLGFGLAGALIGPAVGLAFATRRRRAATPGNHRSQDRYLAHSRFTVGPYKLDADITGLDGLIEFTPIDYQTMGRRFEAEINYHAPLIIFFGKPWRVMLQTVNRRIYKIAIYLATSSLSDSNPIASILLAYFGRELGAPAQYSVGLFVWDYVGGNIILQTGETSDGPVIALFLTSRSAYTAKSTPADMKHR